MRCRQVHAGYGTRRSSTMRSETARARLGDGSAATCGTRDPAVVLELLQEQLGQSMRERFQHSLELSLKTLGVQIPMRDLRNPSQILKDAIWLQT